jgi:aspartyl-tRNA(Asn)/glutamyl-tRNA(Gln) amidotransferase subunit A
MRSNNADSVSGNYAQDPGSIAQFAEAIRQGKLTAVELAQRYLDRIAVANPHVECWRHVDAQRVLADAQLRDAEVKAGRIRGALHGIPVAIKDIIDVEGVQTLANCQARRDIAPATGDAEIVLALRNAGAIILGKVHTTEFAFFDPSPARNPHNLAHTPGGSSSGSAAAVASGTAPLAIGTQTVASVNRPAAYCGIAAFKPSTRSMSTFGITPLGPSYDTPGFYGWRVDDAVYAYEAVAPNFAGNWRQASGDAPIRIVLPVDAHTSDAISCMRNALRRTADALTNAGHAVVEKRSPISFEAMFKMQRSTTLYEAGRALKYLLDHPKGQVGEKLTAAIVEGLAMPMSRYMDERAAIDDMRRDFFTTFADVDVFLWPAAPDTAPKGLEWTGDPKYIAPWTALGGPIVSLPAGKAVNGLPVGCLLAGRPGADRQMTVWARRLAAAAERHD